MIPIEAFRHRLEGSSSAARSIQTTMGQSAPHNSASRLVLELSRPPMTTIASERAASAWASDCRLHVALHIVSKIFKFVHSFFAFSTQESQIKRVEVVCETIVRGMSRRSGAVSSQFDSSSAPSSTTGRRHHPAMAATSGWVQVPMMSTCRPPSSARETIWCMRDTLGQVASMTGRPRRASASWTGRPSPWERISTAAPGGTSSGVSTRPTPMDSR